MYGLFQGEQPIQPHSGGVFHVLVVSRSEGGEGANPPPPYAKAKEKLEIVALA